MDTSVDFNHQAQLMAIEIRNKWPQGVLSAELQALESPVPQKFPGCNLRKRLTPSQKSGIFQALTFHAQNLHLPIPDSLDPSHSAMQCRCA